MRLRALLLVLVGCGPIDDPGDYVAERADVECAQIERCERGYFESVYGDREDCASERGDQLDEWVDAQEDRDCVYVGEEASRCVQRIGNLSCEDWIEGEAAAACDLVWDCTEA